MRTMFAYRIRDGVDSMYHIRKNPLTTDEELDIIRHGSFDNLKDDGWMLSDAEQFKRMMVAHVTMFATSSVVTHTINI